MKIADGIRALVLVNAIVALPAQAILIERPNGLVYDTVLDITWLRDAGQGGSRSWDEALAWADSLVIGEFDDWRLPSMDLNGDGVVENCGGILEEVCRDNELRYMYYHHLGGAFRGDLTGNQGPFENIQERYWSSTLFFHHQTEVWTVSFFDGSAGPGTTSHEWASWAVRDGDVLAVLEPSTALLFAAGMLAVGAGGAWRRRTH